MKVLLLEDDKAQAEQLIAWLESRHYDTRWAPNSKTFLSEFPQYLPDIAILDWELPDGSGVEVLKTLRGRLESDVPVLFTTQRDSESDIVTALNQGADDYLIKPLREMEFTARLSALARRAGVQDQSLSEINEPPYRLNMETKQIFLHDTLVKLTQKDVEVCFCFFRHLGTALSRDFLLKEVWGVGGELDTRTVDVHVSRVRRALKLGPENGFMIKTIFQYGYRLEKMEGQL